MLCRNAPPRRPRRLRRHCAPHRRLFCSAPPSGLKVGLLPHGAHQRPHLVSYVIRQRLGNTPASRLPFSPSRCLDDPDGIGSVAEQESSPRNDCLHLSQASAPTPHLTVPPSTRVLKPPTLAVIMLSSNGGHKALGVSFQGRQLPPTGARLGSGWPLA